MSTTQKHRLSGATYRTALGAVLAVAFAATLQAGGHDDEGEARLAGAWTVQITLRNCDTNAPMGSFASIVTFHRGGTLTESTGSLAFEPGQRSEGHGTWTRLGRNTFRQHVVGLVRFESQPNLPGTPQFDPTKPISPGFKAGWQTVEHRVRLTGADSFESSGATAFFDATGQPYRPGCSTAVGHRFE